jgi:hypothetical protein
LDLNSTIYNPEAKFEISNVRKLDSKVIELINFPSKENIFADIKSSLFALIEIELLLIILIKYGLLLIVLNTPPVTHAVLGPTPTAYQAFTPESLHLNSNQTLL